MLTDEKLAYYKRCYTREGWADLHVSRRVMRDLIEEIERLRADVVEQAGHNSAILSRIGGGGRVPIIHLSVPAVNTVLT